MSKLILTRGVPASGKSTWAKSWVAEDLDRRARLNRDDYRQMMFSLDAGQLEFQQEKAVSAAQQAAARGLLGAGYDVVIDDTNLRAKYVKMWLGFADEVEFVDFPITYEAAVKRDKLRHEAGGRLVGADVIKEVFFDRFIGKDGFSLPPVPELTGDGVEFAKVTHIMGLPKAIIVDIDGTLAHMHDRSPYDPTLYHTDTLDGTIARLVLELADTHQILVTSGRDAKYRPETVEWLRKHNVFYDQLFMRPEGDTRRDDVVKDELYETKIRGKWNVEFALDDRDRVVNMWRAKGIKCLQVQPGNF